MWLSSVIFIEDFYCIFLSAYIIFIVLCKGIIDIIQAYIIFIVPCKDIIDIIHVHKNIQS